MISVIVPFLNELNLDEVEKKVKDVIPGCEIIFSYGDKGKGYALKKGSLKATGDYIAWLDADLQIAPARLNSFLKIMDIYEAEAVIGNKRNDYSIVSYSLFRHVISSGYNIIIKILFGISLRDTQCGIKLFKASTLKAILPNIHSSGFAFDLEALCSLRDNKFIVIDSPVVVNQRVGIGSAIASNIWHTFWETLVVWSRHKKREYIVAKE